MFAKERVRRLVDLEPTPVEQGRVDVIGIDHNLVRYSVRAQHLDETGRLREGHVAVIVGVHEQHG